MTSPCGPHTHTHTVIASLYYLPDVRGINGVSVCESKWSYHVSQYCTVINKATVDNLFRYCRTPVKASKNHFWQFSHSVVEPRWMKGEWGLLFPLVSIAMAKFEELRFRMGWKDQRAELDFPRIRQQWTLCVFACFLWDTTVIGPAVHLQAAPVAAVSHRCWHGKKLKNINCVREQLKFTSELPKQQIKSSDKAGMETQFWCNKEFCSEESRRKKGRDIFEEKSGRILCST